MFQIIHKNSHSCDITNDICETAFNDETEAGNMLRQYIWHTDIYAGDTLTIVEKK